VGSRRNARTAQPPRAGRDPQGQRVTRPRDAECGPDDALPGACRDDRLRPVGTAPPILMLLGCLLAGGLKAEPARCETKVQDGKTLQICTRTDANCESLAKEQIRAPSDKWNGCARPAIIQISYLTLIPSVSSPDVNVLLVPSYVDSERVDITITVEQPNHTYAEHTFRDVPVIIRDNIPTASISYGTPQYPVGVPTVEATEKGGEKEASHSYK
jgi:hypothetical protein